MGYQLLTGATGLLGSYLLRDALLSEKPIAVLARGGTGESAQQRIETIVAGWERRLAVRLPRPVVLVGDLTQPGLGLDRDQKRWVERCCASVLHSGASLRFVGDDPSGEPWLTNVVGTRNVLELCRGTGIRQLHYVSTAYTCGLREGPILERELDVGQTPGNAYEQSKIEAERLVRSADFPVPPTIYRPSIIVGDSRTGYTTTFHGFYTPLKAVLSAAHLIDPHWISARPLMAALGLSGSERKNLVPVDWVSGVITHIVDRPRHHGRVYHVTTDKPVAVGLVTEMMEAAVRAQLGRNGHAVGAGRGEDIVSHFLDQMQVYRTYWRDDPEFDRQNLQAAAVQLTCPELTREVLARLIDFALRANFGWPRSKPIVADFNVADHLRSVVPLHWEWDNVNGTEARFGLQVNGPGGGNWELIVRKGTLVAAEQGLSEGSRARFYLNTQTFRELVAGTLTAPQAVTAGRVLLEGDGLNDGELVAVLQSVTTARTQPQSAS